MKLLAEITEKDVNAVSEPTEERIAYNVRKACRAVLLNDTGKVALLHVTKHGIYKLPGGGVDAGETYPEALARELMEEAGCVAEVTDEVGMTIEYRDQWKLIQFSFCFIARVTKDTGSLNLMPDEAEDGFELVWMDIPEAIKVMTASVATMYDAYFMRQRDLILLTEAQRLIK